jgi:acyl-CoA reductase-like NAD-dependent aldehyde dehydrogenase
MSVQPDPAVKDPSTDVTASYALEAAFVRALTDRIVSGTGRSVPTYCPFNGQPIGTVPQSSADDVAEAFRRARRAQERWARTTVDERQALLLRLHDLIFERQSEIADVICWESGKARKDAYDEPLHVALTARTYGRPGHRLQDTQRVSCVGS